MTDEDVLRLERPQPAWRRQLQERVNAQPVVADREERVRAERIGGHEHLQLGPPERDLLPALRPLDLDHLERCSRQRFRHHEPRHAEPLGQSRSIAVVPVEKLNHPGGRAERRGPVDRVGPIDRVEEPDALVGCEGVGRPGHGLVDDPREAVETEVVAEAERHARRA